jgi:prepilin-type N-terminal cleavage/methylation domain-containing protein
MGEGDPRYVCGPVFMKQRGMAAIELLCVMAIISIFAIQALPKVNMLDNLRLDYEVAHFVSDLRWLQQLAMSSQWYDTRFMLAEAKHKVFMRFDQDGYSIESDIILQEHHFYKGIKMMFPTNSIIFAMDGQMLTPLTIWVYSDKGTRLVIIDRVGRIRVQKK